MTVAYQTTVYYQRVDNGILVRWWDEHEAKRDELLTDAEFQERLQAIWGPRKYDLVECDFADPDGQDRR